MNQPYEIHEIRLWRLPAINLRYPARKLRRVMGGDVVDSEREPSLELVIRSAGDASVPQDMLGWNARRGTIRCGRLSLCVNTCLLGLTFPLLQAFCHIGLQHYPSGWLNRRQCSPALYNWR